MLIADHLLKRKSPDTWIHVEKILLIQEKISIATSRREQFPLESLDARSIFLPKNDIDIEGNIFRENTGIFNETSNFSTS